MHKRDKIVRDEFDYAFIIHWVYDCVYRRFLKSMVIIDFSKSFPVDQSECLLETHRMIKDIVQAFLGGIAHPLEVAL